jgi:hypothetical protein
MARVINHRIERKNEMNQWLAKRCYVVISIMLCFFSVINCFASETKVLSDDDIVKRWTWDLDKQKVSAKVMKDGDAKILFVLNKYENDPVNPYSHLPVPRSVNPGSVNYEYYKNYSTIVIGKLCETALEGKDFSKVKFVVEDATSNRFSATIELSDYKLLMEKKIKQHDFNQKIVFSFE